MLGVWLSHGKSGVITTTNDTRTLSLHVLASAGFGKSYPFRDPTDPHGTENTYRNSLSLILDNAILVMVASPAILSLPFMPKAWARIGRAIVDFKKYMVNILEEEKYLISQGRKGKENLMTSLIRASAESVRSKHESEINESNAMRHGSVGLTASEIFGNIFVFNFAGHDTTANTLSYCVLLLAAHPTYQDWIAEELQHVLEDEDPETWDYDEVFPKLKRCLAILVR